LKKNGFVNDIEQFWKKIEAPRSKRRGIFDRKEVCHFQIRSLTPQQAAGNALAFAVHEAWNVKIANCLRALARI